MYYSQFGQDKFLNEKIFRGKRGGVFVDIGANDGISYSNTFFFEKHLNWKGICFEPLSDTFKKLEKNRKSININGCASDKNQSDVFVAVSGYAEMLSGLKSKYSKQHFERVVKEVSCHGGKIDEIEVACFNINEVLKKCGFKKIDFISIDTEGSEFDIVKAIDYSYFEVKAFTIENNYKSNLIKEFLLSKNFKLVKRIASDEVFVNANFMTYFERFFGYKFL